MRACPECGASGTVALRPVLVALPLGTWSLAGAQIKTSAWSGYVLECSACPFRVTGHVEGLEADEDGMITAGTFVADGPMTRADTSAPPPV